MSRADDLRPAPHQMVYGLRCMLCHTAFVVDTAQHPGLRGLIEPRLRDLAWPVAEEAGWRLASDAGRAVVCPVHAPLVDDLPAPPDLPGAGGG